MRFFEDSIASYKDVGHHGYYIANGKNFLYRYNAYVEATQSHTTVDWNFNDELYKTVNWGRPLNRSLPDIYKDRAQQLRDQYDYLILAFSGGSDSDSMLHAFLDNKIPVDEVWVDWPLGLMDKTNFRPSTDLDYVNLASEWHYTVAPKLNFLRAQHPEIKIHVSDSSSLGSMEDQDDTSIIVGFRTSYQNVTRMRYICSYQQQLFDQGLQVALVTGTEKPNMLIKDNNLCAFFSDLPTVFKSDITPDRHTRVEFFYWSPDSPYMVVNQLHEVIKYLQQNFEEFERIEHHLRTNDHLIDRTKNLDRAINQACYPTWKKTFQTNKFIYTFESNQFNSLLLPYIHTEKFAKVYHHRYFADSAVIRPDLIFHPQQKNRGKNMTKFYPIMSIQKFLQGVNKK